MTNLANVFDVTITRIRTPAVAVEEPCGSGQTSSRVKATSMPMGVSEKPMAAEALEAGSTCSLREETSRVITCWQKVCELQLNH